jgi:hypothetical protein
MEDERVRPNQAGDPRSYTRGLMAGSSVRCRSGPAGPASALTGPSAHPRSPERGPIEKVRDGCVATGGRVTIRAHPSAVSLKPVDREHASGCNEAIRAHPSAAPLKPADCQRVDLRALSIPRSSERGLIEAPVVSAGSGSTTTIRAHPSGTSLKPYEHHRRQARHGPIRAHPSAAPLKLPVHGGGPREGAAFRAHPSAAPLKPPNVLLRNAG